MEFKRVSSGDSLNIPAKTYNVFCDAAEDFIDRTGGGPSTRGGAGSRDPDIVLVRNDSGAAVARYGILGIDDVIITPTANLDEFKQRVALSGVTPTTDHADSFVVLLEPLGDGVIGQAVVSGAVQVQIDIVAESDTTCEAANGDSQKLKSGGGSCRILWKESGTGTKWAVVRLGGGGSGDRVTGVTTGAVDSEDETFSIESVSAISGTAPEDDPLTVYNVFSWTIDEGGRVNAEWNVTSGHWEAYQVECPST